MRIKIARIITRMDMGGAQQAVLSLSRQLDPRVFEQVLITGEGGLLWPELSTIPSVKHYIVSDLTRQVRATGLWTDIKAIHKMRNILRKERPHIAHTHTPKAGVLGRWAAWLAGVPRIVHTFHGFGFGEFHPYWQRMLYIWTERITARITTDFVAVSERNRSKAESYRLFANGECHLIRSGIDFSAFENVVVDKSQKKIELGLCPSDRIVGTVAGFKPPKALHHFVEVAKRVSDQMTGVKFLMVGDGELRPQLQDQIARLGLNSIVKMTGLRRDVPELLQIFDVFLMTSLWEGVPRALVEASLAGIPSVATDVDGVGEAIEHGKNGFLVDPGDIEGLANRIVQLLRDEELRTQLGRVGRSIGNQFSTEKVLEDYTRLYLRMTNLQDRLAS